MEASDPRPPDQTRLLRTHGWIAAVAFVSAWVVVGLVVFPDTGPGGSVTVPAVLGLPYDAAARRLADSGLRASLGESRLSGEAPKSTVLSQSPAAGSRVPRGERISLDVSAGQARAVIPRLAGNPRAQAEAALRAVGLEVGVVSEQSDPRARGTVLSSQPAAGTAVPAGTAVDLVISSGPAELSVPDLVGRDLSEARNTLEQLGLTLGNVVYDSASTYPSGQVLAQLPAAGSLTAPGAAITLRVSGKP
jgi:serine/threonine-protein kinase